MIACAFLRQLPPRRLRRLALRHGEPMLPPTDDTADAGPATSDAPPGANRGQVLVMMGLFLVSLMGMLGLATDVGFAMAAQRAVQGAADAGALAGAREIARYTTAAPTKSGPAVTAVVTANAFAGITPTVYQCEYIGDNWGVVGQCTSNVPSNASGSRVRTRATFDTYFIQVVPGAPDEVTVKGYAKARVQKAGYSTGGPFIICGPHSWAVFSVAGLPVNLDIPIWVNGKINPSAVGVTYRVHDPQLNQTSGVKKDAGCKAKSARFNGLNDMSENDGKTVNQWFDYDEGTRAGPARSAVDGVEGCDTTDESPYNCIMILPIATNNPEETNNSKQVYVVGWAAFHITQAAANRHNAKLLDDYVLPGPGADGWCRDCGGAVVIRLIW